MACRSPRDWDDTDAFRISGSYDFNEKFTGMLGFAVDSNPVPDETIGFQLPDSDRPALLDRWSLQHQ